MIQKLRSLLLVLCVSITGFAQVANQPSDLAICDDISNDGIAEFDLNVLNPEVLGGQNPADFSVTYHINQANADNGTNALNMPYTNVTNPQLIYIRVTENSSGNFDIAFVTITVASGPSPATPTPLIACDLDGDGITEFDLESRLVEILNGEDGIVTFHETLTDAEIGANPLPPFYTNIVANTQILYVRVEGVVANCSTIVELELIVNNGPEHNAPFDYVICENDGNETETIVLIDMISSIFDFTNPDFTLNLYETLADAQVMVDPIFNDFTNTSNPQTLYYTLEDITTGCFTISNFEIGIIACDDDEDMDTVANSSEDVNGDGNFADEDTDLDNIPNYLDNNDDGDAVLTIDEDYNNNGDPTDDDTNMNNIPDYLDADVALSLNDLAINAFKMFPNPAENILNIELAAGNQELAYAMYTLDGKLVLKAGLGVDNLQQIDISRLTAGLYFVTLTSGQLETTKKLVVE